MEWISSFSQAMVREAEWAIQGYSALFSCLTLFPHLLVKIQNSFLCMC